MIYRFANCESMSFS